MLRRVKAIIAYDGSLYQGFQKQTSTSKTITHDIEYALKSLSISSPIVGSGRTDTGVHATGQVIHFDIPKYWQDLERLKTHLNHKLVAIYCKHITFVDDDFHARFSAKKRLYRYVFKTLKPSVFEQKYVSYCPVENTDSIEEILQYFRGKHDFDLFRKTGTETHTSIREVYHTRYIQRGAYHYIYFEANGFLRAQVRMMVESTLLCARAKLTTTQLLEQLSCKVKHTSKLAPPEGLYLAKIIY